MTRKRRKEIVEFIIKNYPKSCIACNTKGKTMDEIILPDEQDEDAGDFVNMEDLKSFFYHEIIGFCGCGDPDMMLVLFIKYLKIYSSSHWTKMAALDDLQEQDEEKYYLMAYTIDRCEFTTHGSSIGGAWLTDLGKMALEVFVGYLEWTQQSHRIPADPPHCPIDDIKEENPLDSTFKQFAAYQDWRMKRDLEKITPKTQEEKK